MEREIQIGSNQLVNKIKKFLGKLTQVLQQDQQAKNIIIYDGESQVFKTIKKQLDPRFLSFGIICQGKRDMLIDHLWLKYKSSIKTTNTHSKEGLFIIASKFIDDMNKILDNLENFKKTLTEKQKLVFILKSIDFLENISFENIDGKNQTHDEFIKKTLDKIVQNVLTEI